MKKWLKGVGQFFANVWNGSWRNKLMLIIGGLIMLAVMIFLPYAIITRHGDVGFLESRWEKGDLPLTCWYAESAAPHMEHFHKAAEEFNQRVGKTLISKCLPWQIPKGDLHRPMLNTVIVHVGAPPQDWKDGVVVTTPWSSHPGGVTVLYKHKDNPKHVYGVLVYIEPKYTTNDSVWLHEVGHVLALAHDRLRDTIMWPTIQERPGGLSNKDVRELKKAYK